MGARDQLRRAGAAAGELEKGDLVGGGRRRLEIVCGFSHQRFQPVFRLIVVAQDHLPQRRLRSAQRVDKTVVGEQPMVAIGDQQRGFDLCGVGLQLGALVAK